MKGFLIAFTIFMVWSFFGLWIYSSFQTTAFASEVLEDELSISTISLSEESNKANIKDAVELSYPQKDTLSYRKKEKLNGLTTLNDQGDTLFLFGQGVSIVKNSSELFIPESILGFKDNIKDYLLEYPNKEVHINSIYSPSENAQVPNLGIQRGEKIMEILLNTEIPFEKIVIKPVIKDITFSEVGGYRNAISIRFKALNENRVAKLNEKQIDKLKPKLPRSRNVYPEFSHSGIIINKNARNLLTELKQIIIKYPEINIELVGHTDRIGSEIDNFKTGLEYAKQLELYLVNEGGIDASRIKYSSKGETQPLESIHSSANTLANRRITVVFY
jgi:outer membrane protein OmpA-like peptidoglycan-associated protein